MFFSLKFSVHLLLKEKKLSEFEISPLFSSLPHFKDHSEIFFFFLLLANDFSNKNIDYSRLLSDSEFS